MQRPSPYAPARSCPTAGSAAEGGLFRMTRYAAPGSEGAIVSYQSRYDHYIGGEYVPPDRGQYFENPSPVNGQPFTEVARGTAEDVEAALDVAPAAAPGWGRRRSAERRGVGEG